MRETGFETGLKMEQGVQQYEVGKGEGQKGVLMEELKGKIGVGC